MKKTILAVILLTAAGGAAYYLLQKKNNVIAVYQQEQIIGKWKIDAIKEGKDSASFLVGIMALVDPDLLNYHYDFRADGKILKLLKDSVQKDTVIYEWTKNNMIVWKERGDSVGESLNISKLSKDSLVLQSKDNTFVYFTKLK